MSFFTTIRNSLRRASLSADGSTDLVRSASASDGTRSASFDLDTRRSGSVLLATARDARVAELEALVAAKDRQLAEEKQRHADAEARRKKDLSVLEECMREALDELSSTKQALDYARGQVEIFQWIQASRAEIEEFKHAAKRARRAARQAEVAPAVDAPSSFALASVVTNAAVVAPATDNVKTPAVIEATTEALSASLPAPLSVNSGLANSIVDLLDAMGPCSSVVHAAETVVSSLTMASLVLLAPSEKAARGKRTKKTTSRQARSEKENASDYRPVVWALGVRNKST